MLSTKLVRRDRCLLLSYIRLCKQVCELLQRAGLELGLLPELGGQEAVRVLERSKGSLDEVTEGACVATGGGVAVLDTRHLQHLLGCARCNNTCMTSNASEASSWHGSYIMHTHNTIPTQVTAGSSWASVRNLMERSKAISMLDKAISGLFHEG